MIQGSIKLIKKDSNGKVLKEVEFVIKSSDGAEAAKAKTDSAGEVTFDGLIPDTYTITETKTIGGKTLLKEPITVTLPLTMSQAEIDKQNVDTSKAIKQGDNYYFYHLTYEVANDSTLNLPKTGGWIEHQLLELGMILKRTNKKFVDLQTTKQQIQKNDKKINPKKPRKQAVSTGFQPTKQKISKKL